MVRAQRAWFPEHVLVEGLKVVKREPAGRTLVPAVKVIVISTNVTVTRCNTNRPLQPAPITGLLDHLLPQYFDLKQVVPVAHTKITLSTIEINWLAGLEKLINDQFGRLDLLSRQRPFPRIVIRPIDVILQALQRKMGVEV